MGVLPVNEIKTLDDRDPLAAVAAQFLPGEPGWLYFYANSIGAMPRGAAKALARLEDEWRRLRRRGWSDSDWLDAPARLGDKLAPVVGAEPGSIVVCDSTSINLYKAVRLALAANPGRKTVVAEEGAFPTDLYVAAAAASDAGGFFTKSFTVKEPVGQDVSVVLLTHTDYRSGYRHDLPKITKQAHDAGALVVWDVSHTAGAVECGLASGDADFAVGCGYKYLCGGPGAPAWLYVAPRHHGSAKPVIPGWMGHADPMAFAPEYAPAPGVKRHIAGTPPVAGNALMEAAVDLWRGIDPKEAFAKHTRLSDLLIKIIQSIPNSGLTLASPSDSSRRGGFVSFRHREAKAFAAALEERKVVASYRAPDVVRFGLSPLYHRFADIQALGELLHATEKAT